jgi:hypothetical protein
MKINGCHGSEGYGDPYPTLRNALAPEYAELGAKKVDALFERTFGKAVTAEDVEEIFGSIEKFARDVGQTVSNVAKKAAPFAMNVLSATQGVLAGAALGPLGILGVARSASAGQEGPAEQAVAGSVPSMLGPSGQLTHVLLGVPAAGYLLNILSRPEVLHAFEAMALSPLGRPSVAVAGTQVPVGAFTSLLTQLANQAEAEFIASLESRSEPAPEYLVESTGNSSCDPVGPDQEADVLLHLLQQTADPDKSTRDSSERKYSPAARPVCLLLERHEEPLATRPVLSALKHSTFTRQGDYWIIRYQGHSAILKATRGLNYLGYLLGHPNRDVHVTELIANLAENSNSLAGLRANGHQNAGDQVFTGGFSDAGPVLDAQAKAEYKHRLIELRQELAEAEKFNDRDRSANAREEIDAIAQQLAAAVGLGSRDRRSSSKAERVRSAVTKRIKEAIKRVAHAIPPLGCHLAARIKTGYFCSYNPHPDRPVAWQF